MKLSLKLFVNAALIFALVGFITYLGIVVLSFFGCCAGLSDYTYHKLVIGIVVLGASAFGYCLYNNCNKAV